jgi:hypothetical protein
VQIKKERLVQVTRCTATQTIKSTYSGFQSCSGPERYTKFHDPIVIEPADCQQAAKTGRFKLGGKDYPFEMNVRRSVGDLDNNGNCKVGLYEVNGVPLKSQMATAMCEIYIRQEWASTNDLTGTIKLSEYVMGTPTDRTLVDSGEGAYAWDYSRDAYPDIKSIAVFFHPMEQIEVASGKFNMVTTEAEFTRLESELSFLQVRSTMTLQEKIRQVKAEICEDRKQTAHTRLESIAGGENPYSLMQVFGRGHQVTRNGATVYVTRC